jgi:diguanylate cyclase (GGDEF)-like protein/PAS domain S-box-containing protein
MESILSAASYRWNPWAVPTLVTALAMIGFGGLTLARERGSREARVFAVLSLAVTIWLGCFSLMYLSREEATGLVWARAAYLGISLIPALVCHFALAVTRSARGRPGWLWLAWALSGGFLYGMVGTGALLRDLYHYSWGFYPRFRWLGAPYLLFFAVLLLLALRIYRRDLATATTAEHRERSRWLMIGFGIAYVAAIDFVPAYGVAVYPFGYLAILGFIALAARTMRRYRLVDFTPELAAREVFSTIADPLLLCDLSGRVRLVNRAAREVLGRGDAELVGRPLADLAAGENGNAELLRVALARGTGRVDEVALRGAGGAAVPFEVDVSPVVDPGGVVVGTLALARDQRARKRSEAALRANEERFRSLAENAPAAIFIVDGERIQYSNQAARSITGYGAEELRELPFWQLIDAEARERLRQQANPASGPAAPLRREVRLATRYAGGTPRWVDLTLSPLVQPEGVAITATAFDIHEMKAAEDAALTSERRLRDLLETIHLVAIMLDVDGNVTFCNRYVEELLGYGAEEILGRNWFASFVPADQAGELERAFAATIHDGAITPYEESDVQTRTGERRWIAWSNAVLRDRHGKVVGAAQIGADITERKRAEERLVHEALHDALTGLPNRALFLDRLRGAITRSRRRGNYGFAVLFLDLDRFKLVNDSLGHLLGDQLLIQVARRLQGCLRPGDTIARLGGDEFTVLLEDMDDAAEASRVAERIRLVFVAPFDVQGHDVFTTASIGIALGGPRYDRPEAVLRDADTALHRAKAEGKARHRIFDTPMHVAAVEHLQLESDLRRALEREEFRLCYQPIVDLEDGAVIGFEALVRWQHPERGLLQPDAFIPLTEETGMVMALGEWVLRESCRQLAVWDATIPGAEALSVTVNLSSRQIDDRDLVERVAAAVQDAGIEPRRLKLEVTESLIVENPTLAAELLTRIKALGCEICLDDFGTGYSSLSYLLRLPIDVIKVDRSFLVDLKRGTRNADIVWAVLELARRLGMRVIAEGVETHSQVLHLKELECAYAQGYYFSRPLAAEVAVDLATSRMVSIGPAS